VNMANVYREGVEDERLLAVVEHIRRWFLAGRPVVKKTTTKRTRKPSGAAV